MKEQPQPGGSETSSVATEFAPAERAGAEQLAREIEFISKNPVIDGIMESVGGMLAVLNEQRQIVALNQRFLETLEVKDATEVLGLRPGEAVGCIHAEEDPGGCGTTRFCSTCGAAIAIVTALATDRPVERDCALEFERNGMQSELFLSVRGAPIELDGRRYLMLLLRDISVEQRRAALERVFYHDLSNLMQGVKIAVYLLATQGEGERQELILQIQRMTERLAKEIEIQSALVNEDSGHYRLQPESIRVGEIVRDLRDHFASHAAAENKQLILSEIEEDLELQADRSLAMRILVNMLTNAFEATDEGGVVRMWVETKDDTLVFCVWNHLNIGDDIARRIFQRNFTTSNEPGRGLGTFAMKFFTEKCLSGRVDFTTSRAKGTVFRVELPFCMQPAT